MPWLRRIGGSYLLPIWFATFSVYHFRWISEGGLLGLDARIYHRGAAAWLAGGDPWTASVATPGGSTYHFAGLPPTVLVFAPTAWLPESVVAATWTIASFAAGAWIIRRLRLAWWWLLFPPLVMGALSANPGIVLLALLLTRWPPAEGVAAALKVYAILPMLAGRRWYGLAAFGLLCLAALPLWLRWDPTDVTGRLLQEAGGGSGATAHWSLILPAVFALVAIARFDLRTAAYLAIPALWPSAQYHYAVMALPVIQVWPAILFAVPVPGISTVAVLLYAWLLVRKLNNARHDHDVPIWPSTRDV